MFYNSLMDNLWNNNITLAFNDPINSNHNTQFGEPTLTIDYSLIQRKVHGYDTPYIKYDEHLYSIDVLNEIGLKSEPLLTISIEGELTKEEKERIFYTAFIHNNIRLQNLLNEKCKIPQKYVEEYIRSVETENYQNNKVQNYVIGNTTYHTLDAYLSEIFTLHNNDRTGKYAYNIAAKNQGLKCENNDDYCIVFNDGLEKFYAYGDGTYSAQETNFFNNLVDTLMNHKYPELNRFIFLIFFNNYMGSFQNIDEFFNLKNKSLHYDLTKNNYNGVYDPHSHSIKYYKDYVTTSKIYPCAINTRVKDFLDESSSFHQAFLHEYVMNILFNEKFIKDPENEEENYTITLQEMIDTFYKNNNSETTYTHLIHHNNTLIDYVVPWFMSSQDSIEIIVMVLEYNYPYRVIYNFFSEISRFFDTKLVADYLHSLNNKLEKEIISIKKMYFDDESETHIKALLKPHIFDVFYHAPHMEKMEQDEYNDVMNNLTDEEKLQIIEAKKNLYNYFYSQNSINDNNFLKGTKDGKITENGDYLISKLPYDAYEMNEKKNNSTYCTSTMPVWNYHNTILDIGKISIYKRLRNSLIRGSYFALPLSSKEFFSSLYDYEEFTGRIPEDLLAFFITRMMNNSNNDFDDDQFMEYYINFVEHVMSLTKIRFTDGFDYFEEDAEYWRNAIFNTIAIIASKTMSEILYHEDDDNQIIFSWKLKTYDYPKLLEHVDQLEKELEKTND